MAALKVLVGVKRVIDFAVKVRVAPGGLAVQSQGVKHALNPFCEIALEEAVRLRERGAAAHVLAVSVGTSVCQETLRAALALGADRAVLVQLQEGEGPPGPREVAAALGGVVAREKPQLVILGKQAIDDDCNQTGQLLAAMLDWPQATFASRVELEPGAVRVQREVDGGLETLRLRLPALITADLRLNEPRYATLPNIMKAKKKPLEVVEWAGLGLPPPLPRLRVLALEEPPARGGGERVDDVTALVDKLRQCGRI
ncbi:electron transfer flavoprotein subunit beta [Columba livia]|uniref:electron transfer flavoprotein subunit beta n=1 Tax=Columba livia TaxID=8932 RepID=UPI0031B9EFAF